MRKLSRWYDVEVRFDDEHLKTEAFYGVVSRFDHISKVLSKLEQIGDVRFQIKGNTVHVQKK